MSTELGHEPAPGDLQPGLYESRRVLLSVGVALGLLGLVAIVFPHVSSVSLAVVLGTILVVGGTIQVAHAFSARDWRGVVWQGLVAALFTALGILVLANPSLGLLSLWVLLVALFLTVGVAQFVLGVGIRGEPNWQWPLVAGSVSILAAVALWLGLPSPEPWGIGLVFGIAVATTGLALVMLAVGARPAEPTEDATPAAGRASER
ncbi:HdeD family acid-resistance protein [Haloarchaeobius amylolyticus]|uniref:HdeD family acid-resistance protein n=1 Tax=Haloarchaeobius amylolyticus TaxID=1198296 RepID=UPI00226D697F|nr:HdeD family acid-resistance protein [Haloarchaeobius amylolyticus]